MDTSEATIAIVSIVGSFAMPLLLVAGVLYYKHCKLRMIHETIARIAEKGLPVPPELMHPASPGHSGLRGGLILVALGIALAVFMVQVRGLEGPWSIGLIPGLIGLALIVSWAIESRRGR